MQREENLVHGGWEGVGAATVESSVEFPQKTKRRTTYHMIQQFHSRVCAGVQPRLIQGIRRRDSIGDLFI